MKTITLLLAAAGALLLSSCACSKSGASCCATKPASECKTCDMSAKKGATAKHDMKAM